MRSYRIAQDSVEVIEAAAKVTGVSMGMILEECVTEAIDIVTHRLLKAEVQKKQIQIEKLASIRNISKRRARRRSLHS